MSKRTSSDAGLSLYDSEDEIIIKKSNDSTDDPESMTATVESKTNNEITIDNNNGLIVVGFSTRQGKRDQMEDRHVIEDKFDKEIVPVCNIERSCFFGLFDGHAGHSASDFCSKRFVSTVAFHCRKYASPGNDVTILEKSVKKVFLDSFKKIDEEFLSIARQSRPPLRDGSTATVLLLINNVLYSANIGDSRAVLCRKRLDSDSYIAMPITVDHSPMIYDERIRIQKAGGFVKDGRVQGIIEVSRSIGDGSFKNLGVICVPDVKKVTLTDDDKFVILACDGLWKVFSSEDAMNFVTKKFELMKTNIKMSKEFLTILADELSLEAVSRGCNDNVSVIIIYFNKGI